VMSSTASFIALDRSRAVSPKPISTTMTPMNDSRILARMGRLEMRALLNKAVTFLPEKTAPPGNTSEILMRG
jgi:hypothetical protein